MATLMSRPHTQNISFVYPGMAQPEPGPELAQRSITVRKKVIYVRTIRREPKLINGMREIAVPFVTEERMISRVPIKTYVEQRFKVPKVTWKTVIIPEAEVKCEKKLVSEPREVCQAVLCQPLPQVIPVPQPQEYCCYSTGPASLNCKPAASYQCTECPPHVSPGPSMPFFPPCPPCPPHCTPAPGLQRLC